MRKLSFSISMKHHTHSTVQSAEIEIDSTLTYDARMYNNICRDTSVGANVHCIMDTISNYQGVWLV